jgi:hypothetical protein
MIDPNNVLDILAATQARKAERRQFLKIAGGSSVAIGGIAMLGGCFGDDDDGEVIVPPPTPTPPPAAITDNDILNLALNLEYLEAQFYSFATTGAALPANLTASGTGTAGGTITGGAAVNFTADPVVGSYAREIAFNERTHVTFLRSVLGSAAIAMPNINISGDATGAFTAAARAAGVVGATETFNPYASPENFLLAAYLFEDVGVTAYKGAAPLLTSKVVLEAAAGILAAEAYHAGLIRTVLTAKGMSNGALITAAGRISDARDLLDGTPADDPVRGIGADDDQGIALTGSGSTLTSNIVPANANAIAYSRTSPQVHNIVYLNTTGTNRNGGGFFPNGTNNPNPTLRVGL